MIGNWKEWLIMILVMLFISCLVWILVYIVLVGFVVFFRMVFGIFNMQGLVFMGLYLFGIVSVLGVAYIFKFILKICEQSFFMFELFEYWVFVVCNVGLMVWEKVQFFVVEVGKIILGVFIIFWFLASYGLLGEMVVVEMEVLFVVEQFQFDEIEIDNLVVFCKIEVFFVGYIGKVVEFVIWLLGYDWKIGIVFIILFVVCEVFVGIMAIIYSIGLADDEFMVWEWMVQEWNLLMGELVYNFVMVLFLLLFYVFVMQCMSMVVVVKWEIKSWKWLVIQFVFMIGLAYLSVLLAYQLLSQSEIVGYLWQWKLFCWVFIFNLLF